MIGTKSRGIGVHRPSIDNLSRLYVIKNITVFQGNLSQQDNVRYMGSDTTFLGRSTDRGIILKYFKEFCLWGV